MSKNNLYDASIKISEVIDDICSQLNNKTIDDPLKVIQKHCLKNDLSEEFVSSLYFILLRHTSIVSSKYRI